MSPPTFRFDAQVWQTTTDPPWVFATVPFDEADAIDELARPVRRGFGSVRVEVRIGATTWRTSLFPDGRRKTFVLPLKRAVREAEALAAGGTARVELTLVDL